MNGLIWFLAITQLILLFTEWEFGYLRRIRVFLSGTLSQTPKLANFSAFLSQQVDRRKCCQLSSILACLLQSASIFVCTTFAIMQHVRLWQLILVNETIADGVAVTSTGPCANYLHDLAPDRLPRQYFTLHQTAVRWRFGVVATSLVSINEVNLRWARLVLGWVIVSGLDSQRRHFISVFNQPPRSTQPFTLRVTVKWVPAKGRWCSAAGE